MSVNEVIGLIHSLGKETYSPVLMVTVVVITDLAQGLTLPPLGIHADIALYAFNSYSYIES